MRRAALTAVQAGLLLLPLVLAFASGGFFAGPRLIAAICAWALLAVAVLAVPGRCSRGPRRPRGARRVRGPHRPGRGSRRGGPRARRAPTGGRARAALPPALCAGAIVWRERRAARLVEPLLAGVALVVIGYGLAGRLLPGVVHLAASARAGGRLEQPLTYWNATGALAAIGVVLCARLAGDATRPGALRAAAAAAAAPLGMGAYLSFSRGAIACLLAGLAALVRARADTAAQLRAVAVVLAAAVLASAAAAPFGAVRALERAHATAEGLVGARAARGDRGRRRARAAARGRRDGAGRPVLRRRAGRGGRRRPGAAPYAAVVVARAREPVARRRVRRHERPAVGSRSHRLAYWRVALDVAADHPLAGAGPGSFGVDWLQRRKIDERVRNAHSLELETLADLGLIGPRLLAAVLAATALASAGALRADRALAAGPAAAALTGALHAGLDWDWEMPARHARRRRARRAAPRPGRRGAGRGRARRAAPARAAR